MKKIIVTLLALSFMLPLCAAGIPTRVSAEEALTEETVVSFAESIVWDKKVGDPTTVITEDGVIMSNVSNAWDSAGCDILPALKAAIGDGDSVYLALSVEVTATMKAGREGDTLNARVLMRGTDTRSDLGDSAWNSAYADTLGWDPAVFFKQGGNVMAYLGGGLSLKHGETVLYTTTLELTKNQIASDILSEWVFCVDSLGGMNLSNVEGIEFKNLTIVKAEKPPVDEGELFDPDPVDPDNTDHLTTAYTGEVWSPVEILLRSAVDYANPYVETEIDATFTHADGTAITIPGFWMGGDTWAVRFSPTKAGEWSYVITCSDKSNKGLSKTGTVTASQSSKTTEVSQHGFVTVEKGERYYKHADGTPFFWLGDTNWQAFSNVSTTICNYPGCDCGSQFEHMVNDRVAKGFTVYQTYFVTDSGNGEPSVWKDSRHEHPATGVFNDKIDHMFEYLHEQGMTVALGLGCHTQTPGAMELDDFLRFTRYIVARYGCYSVVWISGQEINIDGKGKTNGYTSFDYYMLASALIEELDGYDHPNSAHMWPMYATDESAVRMDTSDWHDSWTVQGGHGNAWSGNVGHIQSKAFYKSYYTSKGSGFYKPFIESESNYEDINCGPFTGYEANRIGAWRAMLCGSAGFTYGVSGIWASSFSTSGFTGWYGATTSYSYDPWYAGLNKPGSYEVSYMKAFFLDIGPWYELIPRFDDRSYARMLSKEEYLLASTEDSSLVVCYFYHTSETRSLGELYKLDDSKTYDTYWFDPRTGKYIPIDKGIRTTDGDYTIPKLPDSRDWVFLMSSLGLDEHYEESLPEDLNPDYTQNTPSGTPITPADVTAVGGITYSGSDKATQTMTDHTSWLYDGDPATVWVPSAHRATQTFVFDLGAAHKLTYITISPLKGTVIPHFRVSGSNDGIHWTVITDTSIRKATYPGSGNEPLAGTYRYVKVLLLNPQNVSNASYETMTNPIQGETYSVTKITDILIYTDGEGTPTPEILVGVPGADDPGTDTPGDETTETEAVTVPTDTSAPAEDTSVEESDTVPNMGEKKGCGSVLGVRVVGLLTAIAACLVMRKSKERDGE